MQVTPLRRTLASSPNPNVLVAFSAFTLLVGWQEGPVKNGMFGRGVTIMHYINLHFTYLLTRGGHWLVRMEWCPAGWSVCLPLLIFPCTKKSRSSLLALAHPGGPEKGRKMVVM